MLPIIKRKQVSIVLKRHACFCRIFKKNFSERKSVLAEEKTWLAEVAEAEMVEGFDSLVEVGLP